MISMIQAHQKGDIATIKAISSKVMEERRIKRTNLLLKRSKSILLNSKADTQQVIRTAQNSKLLVVYVDYIAIGLPISADHRRVK